ncbi:MAG: hypothetical protein P4L93_10565 [Coriobacteriia bacterium]|nr:hypothetical protein [Coriobacteriia bacterium]
MLGKRSVARLLLIVAAVAALTMAFASAALAAPTVPIMTFNDLRTALGSGPLDGYMATVVQGSDIATIPLKVLAVPKTGDAYDEGSLITFDATGSVIAQYGGIVAGMSGSPVYVKTASGDKLVGAVSYGDYFTLGGRGLATPIEAMSKIETDHATDVVPMSAPVITSSGVINKIIIAPDPQDYSAEAAAGAFVAKPLGSVFIGGMKPTSTMYKALAQDLTAHGVSLVNIEAPLSSGGSGPLFSTEMTAGASVAALAARGDMIVGGAGTVTYVNGNNVLAFGHPAYWSGATSLYMANAWIESVWPSSYEAYKVWDAGAVNGVITQDRRSGVLGKLGAVANETTITATATDRESHATTSSTVYIPRQLFSNGMADGSMAAAAVYMAGYNLYDQSLLAGSAYTTTTVDVADGKGSSYEVVIPNHIDSPDTVYDASMDSEMAIDDLQSVLQWGNEDLRILSVRLEGTYSAKHERATIVGVEAPNGVKIGANRVNVQAIVYGQEATQTIATTLTVPAGTALGGTISATSLDTGSSDDQTDSEAPVARTTIAGEVKDLNNSLPQSTVAVTFQPSLSGQDSSSFTKPPSTTPITANTVTQWPITGYAETDVTQINILDASGSISFGDWPYIVGEIDGPSDPTTVTVYATQAGSSVETLIDTTQPTLSDGSLEFEFFDLPPIYTNTTYRVHVDATPGNSGADTYVTVGVKAPVSLRTSAGHIKPGRTVGLTASVYPNTAAGGTVVFERLSGKKWLKLASKTLAVSGSYAKASYSWKPGKGTQKVRARYLGGTYNAANTSGTKAVLVK